MITGEPHFHVVRLDCGLVSDDEREAVEAYVRKHGFELNDAGEWRRKPRGRRPDPAPLAGEFLTTPERDAKNATPEPWFYRLHRRKDAR